MATVINRLILPIRPAGTSTFRIINPSTRTAAAFARKRTDGRPLKHMPRKSRKPQDRQKAHQEKLSMPSTPKPAVYEAPPLPIQIPSAQQLNPTEPYFVRRTPTRNLPIYQEAKSGGNLRQTKVRKIEGDVHSLKRELETLLNPLPPWIRVNPITSHIEMKGWYKGQIEQILQGKGF